jgi:uncharacterized YccA/Bax inhibitor family protein
MSRQTGNPAFSDTTFAFDPADRGAASMTLQGTAIKSLFLLLILITAGAFAWQFALGSLGAAAPAVVDQAGRVASLSAIPGQLYGWLAGGSIGAFIVAMIVIFKPKTSPYLAPVYAAFEGVALGMISAVFEYMYRGIVVQAIGLTFGVFFVMLVVYLFGIIKATENFKLGVVAATGGVALFYLVAIVGGLFGFKMPLIHDTGWMGIGFSLLIVVIAAMNLVLDFDFIEQGANNGAPKYMEWYGGFGLMVTLVWLYLELLRLLAKARSSD